MPSTNQKRIGKRPEKETITLNDSLADAWKVMKPFVHFSIKAMKVMAHALIFVVKHIPRPEEEDHKGKGGKVIKIS